ncbi:MAG TPA: subclass B3 metallo-beta-lactamase [Sphingopyxis sp.]|nr:subclass B3 metallo-beta-lactamase [Sphingopyxis sp.]
MLAKLLGVLSLFALTACASTIAEPSKATAFPASSLAAACQGRDGWSDPAPPAHLHGTSYYVGTCGIAAILIDSGAGLILIDAATPEAGPTILANIRALGFDPKNIQILLATHEHHDHAGGLGTVQQASNAAVHALPAAAAALRAGRPYPTDPQAAILDPFTPLRVIADLVDGQPLRLGDFSLTPYATPAHSLGSTSFIWQSCEGTDCKSIAFMDSLSTPAPANYRFTDHPDQQSRVEQGLEKAATLRCDMLITPHPSASSLFERFAGNAPLADPMGCTDYAATAQQNFAQRLAKE